MGKPSTRTCPFCYEKVPVGASRCKFCGSTLPPYKRKRKNLVTWFFFLTTVLFALLAFTWYDHMEQERNRADRLEKRNARLDSLLEDCYSDTAPIEPAYSDSVSEEVD